MKNRIIEIRVRKIITRLRRLYPNAKTTLNFKTNWELLVAVILSAQTTDKKVNEVTKRLFDKYRGLNSYTKATLGDFAKDIKSVNYYKTKAKNILKTARIIKEQYNGKLPKEINELIKLQIGCLLISLNYI